MLRNAKDSMESAGIATNLNIKRYLVFYNRNVKVKTEKMRRKNKIRKQAQMSNLCIKKIGNGKKTVLFHSLSGHVNNQLPIAN